MTKYMAAVLLLVAAMSAQNAPSTTKADGNRGIYCDQGIDLSQDYIVEGHPLKAKHPRHLDIPAISREANGSIVSIVMSDKDGHPIAQGSGFFISEEGCVVTNYHVIRNGSSALVKLPNGAFFAVDGMLASDKDRDVAVIKVHGNAFRTLNLGDSDRLQVGEEVVAIGNPLSLESTVSNGILSAIRTVEDEGGKFLQITAPISPGSSGGPLFNMAGEVIGITTSHLVGGQNLNFAIPINAVKPMLRATFSTVKALPNEPEDKPVTADQTTGPSLEDTLQWMVESSAGGVSYHDSSQDTTTRIVAGVKDHSPCQFIISTILQRPQRHVERWLWVFDLRDMDPDGMSVKNDVIKVRATDNQSKIVLGIDVAADLDHLNSGQLISHAELGGAYLDYAIFAVGDDIYRSRFMKAFKHAAILCGGKPSTF